MNNFHKLIYDIMFSLTFLLRITIRITIQLNWIFYKSSKKPLIYCLIFIIYSIRTQIKNCILFNFNSTIYSPIITFIT